MITMISSWTIYSVATITTSGVVTNLVGSSADETRFTFVNIFARATVRAKFVTIRTFATVAAWCVFTNPYAQISIFELRAFVDVCARTIVRIEPESGVTTASVTSPNVQTRMLAQTRCSLTFIDILTGAAETLGVFKATIADASIRASGILALTSRPTQIAIKTALVNVNAVFIRPIDVARWTHANVTAHPVLAGLTRRTLVATIRALVYVHTILA